MYQNKPFNIETPNYGPVREACPLEKAGAALLTTLTKVQRVLYETLTGLKLDKDELVMGSKADPTGLRSAYLVKRVIDNKPHYEPMNPNQYLDFLVESSLDVETILILKDESNMHMMDVARQVVESLTQNENIISNDWTELVLQLLHAQHAEGLLIKYYLNRKLSR